MAGSSNFVQWNPSGTNQDNDASYATAAGIGALNDANFPSVVANKLFFQMSTFIAAFAQALATQGLNLNDSNITTLATALAAVVVSGVGSSPTFGNVTCNMLTAASLESTTGLECDAGILSGKVGSSQGLYAVVDSSLALHNGATVTISGHQFIGGICVS